jgi:hypothetical protein
MKDHFETDLLTGIEKTFSQNLYDNPLPHLLGKEFYF